MDRMNKAVKAYALADKARRRAKRLMRTDDQSDEANRLFADLNEACRNLEEVIKNAYPIEG